MARIQRQGDRRQKNFTLEEYGTWKAAEAVAARWVRRQIKALPPAVSSKNRLTWRNSSGVVGVHLYRQVICKRSGRKYRYRFWISNWPGCELSGGVKWSINAHGNDDTFVLAVLCRRMETVDRARVLKALTAMRRKPTYRAILKLRRDHR
jgi:hypothetical protein